MTEIVLPAMREDLSLSRGPLSDGAPTWSVYDPARHRFIRLGWLDFEILSRWRLRSPDAILRALGEETTLKATGDDLARFAKFAQTAGLLQPSAAADSQRMALEQAARRRSPLSWLIHNYLFLRIRLIDPDRFLIAAAPLVKGLFTRSGLVFVGLLGLFALYLISRDWETYTHSLVEQTTVQGLLEMGIALSLAKVFHELGHGFAARRFGCRVPSMGIAFLVMWPVLWTDTTDAWRLSDRRQRLMIDTAGMATEILIAALASIAWAILPDGPARSAMFVLSSSTWLLTLLVNLSPLMRFDGYYILSDLLDFPNLQERGFAYTRWFLRELMFRPHLAPPEELSPRMARIIVIYSIVSWVYRFFLFTGIAVLVYHFTFKLLGLFLMGIELWYFVTRPILREVMAWVKLGRSQRLNRHTIFTLGLFALLILVLAVPWRGKVEAPGLRRAERQATLLSSEPGRLTWRVADEAVVKEGEVMFRLESMEIEHAIRTARAQYDSAQSDQTAGVFNPGRRGDAQTAGARVAEAAAAFVRAQARAESLQILAPFSGVVRDIPAGLQPGDDIRRLERLGVLVTGGASVVEAYVAEADLDRVAPGAHAVFIPVDGPTVALKVAEMARVSTRALDVPELASIYGGPVPVRRKEGGALVPDGAIYRVVLVGEAPLPGTLERVVGSVVIDAPARSVLSVVYHRAVAVLMREASP
jgi:putative peptide zinc metalloprotease protein